MHYRTRVIFWYAIFIIDWFLIFVKLSRLHWTAPPSAPTVLAFNDTAANDNASNDTEYNSQLKLPYPSKLMKYKW